MEKFKEKILLVLCENFGLGLTLGELSKEIEMEEDRIKPIIDELESDGFVERQVYENGEVLYELENEGIKFCLTQKRKKLLR